jgi:hypothetical protein
MELEAFNGVLPVQVRDAYQLLGSISSTNLAIVDFRSSNPFQLSI